MTQPYFEIREHQEGAHVRLQLTGELDMASAPVLRNRLEQLCAEDQLVRLDFSGLEFMDCSGIHLLIGAVNDTREKRWAFEVDGEVSPEVERLFRLTDLEGVTGIQLQRSFARQALRT
jgi:anti-anti-sigma factor